MVSILKEIKQAVFLARYVIGGFIILFGLILNALEAEALEENPISTLTAVLRFITAVCPAAADILIPRDPVNNTAIKRISYMMMGISVLTKVIFNSKV